ncbi:DUF2589 domain-containing protein [Massilia sp. DD77]|uniref:DUF2589 domain-containing protein n=1 Tax=Massilia sp. DD77 TaxID=3109349 RepID=UPI002FFE3202
MSIRLGGLPAGIKRAVVDAHRSVAGQHMEELAQLVPVPSLAVTSVEVSFDMEVKSNYTHETDAETSSHTQEQASFDAKAGWGCFSVEVKAEQQPIPEGIKMILDMFSKNMTMKPIIASGNSNSNSNNNNATPIPAPHA